jgi:hypothetical protein
MRLVRRLRAVARAMMNDHAGAAADLRIVVDAMPERLPLRLWLARLLFSAGEYRDCVDVATRLIESNEETIWRSKPASMSLSIE